MQSTEKPMQHHRPKKMAAARMIHKIYALLIKACDYVKIILWEKQRMLLNLPLPASTPATLVAYFMYHGTPSAAPASLLGIMLDIMFCILAAVVGNTS